MASLWQDFKNFLLKQNVLALAVGVLIGTALNTFVMSLVNYILMPTVALVIRDSSWENWQFTIFNSVYYIGFVLQALITFLACAILGWQLSFLIPANHVITKQCWMCYKLEIDERATKCPYCTGDLSYHKIDLKNESIN